MELAPNKTQAIVPTKIVKYLGIRFDPYDNFIRHVNEAVYKEVSTATALSRIMSNVRGPSSHKRRLLANVVIETVLYGVLVRGKAIKYGAVRKKLDQVYRLITLRVARA